MRAIAYFLIACYYFLPFASAIAQPRSSAATPHANSRIVPIHGIPTLEVDGKPFLIVGAQCDIWRSTHQDANTIAFFDGYRDLNATAVSVGIPWSKVETFEGKYEFTFIDWFINQAQTHGLKLVLNLFNTNVCGKVQEGSGSSIYPQYTPTYILSKPDLYQRMVLQGPSPYDSAGPPMCPNDPRTLDRERKYVTQVVKHLKATDRLHTVVMLQLDNEFYYQQWTGQRPTDESTIRCQCQFCNSKWSKSTWKWKNAEEFMFHSFADYVRNLTDAFAQTYDLPVYINSPWWPPYAVPIFLDNCPHLSFVGIDGMFTPHEPNVLSNSMLSRNIAFAAENPTENGETRLNLDVLPYYTLIGRQGIGNLLWECHPPNTVIEDPEASRRYRESLYPIKNAMFPIAMARGTNDILGWYTIRQISSGLDVDKSGNLIPGKAATSVISKSEVFLREGTTTRSVQDDHFEAIVGTLRIAVSQSPAGIAVRYADRDIVFALAKGQLLLGTTKRLRVEAGRFEGATWRVESIVTPIRDLEGYRLNVTAATVLRIRW